MDIRSNDIKILGRIVATTTEGVVADSEQIYDTVLQEKQSDLNQRTAAVTAVRDGNYVLVADKITSFSTLKFRNSRPQIGGECEVRYNVDSIMLDATNVANPNVKGIGTLFADKVSAPVIGYHDSETENNFAEYDSQDKTWNITNIGNMSVSGNIVSDSYITSADKLVIVAKEEDDTRSGTIQYDYQGLLFDFSDTINVPEILMDGYQIIAADERICIASLYAGNLKIDDIIYGNGGISRPITNSYRPSYMLPQTISYEPKFKQFVLYSEIDNIIESGIYFVHTMDISRPDNRTVPYMPAILFVLSGRNVESTLPDTNYVVQSVLQINLDGTIYSDIRHRNSGGTWDKSFLLNRINI